MQHYIIVKFNENIEKEEIINHIKELFKRTNENHRECSITLHSRQNLPFSALTEALFCNSRLKQLSHTLSHVPSPL